MSTSKPIPPIIERVDAWRAGKVRYFSGIPCKRGHIAERYVSTAGCVECLTPLKRRRNAFDKNLTTYLCPTFWVWNDLTPQEYKGLEAYLQTAIDAYCAHIRPGVAVAAQQTFVQPITADRDTSLPDGPIGVL